MTAQLTLGVVGHVDHGKTALVRALTGIETDRLNEEQERGLSIVLGFSYLETDHGVVDLIDVPGHEDFIRAMISGATALDGIVLCIAANEGVMPQTIEHFNIARLIGVERGFVVITKADLADADGLALVKGEVEALTSNSFLQNAPILEASASTGAGIDALRSTIAAAIATPVQRVVSERFFLPLDRVFTMRGFGLVVTGTLRGGPLRVNDRVEIMPAEQSATVRALQNHGRAIECAEPGQRVAVNLRNVNREGVRRGDVVASPGLLTPTRRIDAELTLLDSHPHSIKNGATVRLLTGTTEAIARLRLLDRRSLEPGASCFAQIRLDRDIATRPAEPFLLRSYSPMYTIGGGRILEVNPGRHRRFDAGITERLRTSASGDFELIVAQRLTAAGAVGVRVDTLADELGLDSEFLEQVADRLGAIRVEKRFLVSFATQQSLAADIVAALQQFHSANPHSNGLPTAALPNALPSEASPQVLRYAIESLIEREEVESEHDLLRIAGFDPFASLSVREREWLVEVEGAYRRSGLEPPALQAIVGSDQGKENMYRLLLETGRLVRLRAYDRNSQTVLHAKVLEDVQQALSSRFPPPQPFALKDVRDLLGSTRKHVLPLMEHLDSVGVTVRTADLRRLRDR